MIPNIAPAERDAIASRASINAQYLYQCLTRRRDMDAKLASAVEAVSDRRICRWHLRRDWHLIWPELIGAPGAPAVPSETPAP